MEHLLYAVNSVVPSFLIIALGFVLKRIGVITEEFIKLTSKFVFLVCIPSLVFINISKSNFYQIFSGIEAGIVVGSIILVFIIAWILSFLFVKDRKGQGAFIQGAFRSNFAIIGLAVMNSAFPLTGSAHGAILLAFALPAYNILSIVALSYFGLEEQKTNPKKVLFEIIRNPLIIAVVCALPFALFREPLAALNAQPGISNVTSIFDNAISLLAGIALPLSLVGIGGTLRFSREGKSIVPAVLATTLKVLFAPVLVIIAALFFGIKGEALGILFILSACPTAVASFSMAEAMGSDRELAAEIIVLTTVVSVFTLSAGLAVLAGMGLITPGV
ncbi:MAG: AEC family transporter [Spirochaetales bacterium]|nr:AEC family transporter [Spirochaetales bacterium]